MTPEEREAKINLVRQAVDAQSKELQLEADRVIMGLGELFATLGYDVCSVSLSKRVMIGARVVGMAGAARLFIGKDDAVLPSLPNEARALRQMADQMEEIFTASGAKEAESSYLCELPVEVVE